MVGMAYIRAHRIRRGHTRAFPGKGASKLLVSERNFVEMMSTFTLDEGRSRRRKSPLSENGGYGRSEPVWAGIGMKEWQRGGGTLRSYKMSKKLSKTGQFASLNGKVNSKLKVQQALSYLDEAIITLLANEIMALPG